MKKQAPIHHAFLAPLHPQSSSMLPHSQGGKADARRAVIIIAVTVTVVLLSLIGYYIAILSRGVV